MVTKSVRYGSGSERFGRERRMRYRRRGILIVWPEGRPEAWEVR